MMRSRQQGSSPPPTGGGEEANKKTARSMSSSTASRLSSLSAWGAKMRSFTVGAPGGTKTSSEQQRQRTRPNDSTDGKTGVENIDHPHAYEHNSAIERRSSNVFGSLRTLSSRTDLRSTALVTAASSSGSSSLDRSRGNSSSSTHEEYSIVNGDDAVAEPISSKWYVDSETVYDDDDQKGSVGECFDGNAADHISSANAYLIEEDTVLSAPSSTSPQSIGKRRRLSIPTLSQFRSSSVSFLASPDETDHKAHDRGVEAVVSAVQANTLDSSTPTGTFNLRSFRNVRAGSQNGNDEVALSPRGADALHLTRRQKSFGANDDDQSSAHLTSSPVFTPLSKANSPMNSVPGSPLPDRPVRSRAGSMTVGNFLRAAAATHSRLDLLNNDEDDGFPVAGPGMAVAGSRRGSGVLGSPYRPLTPLGSGARGPGEELAMIEADLERARNHSLRYLAQREEMEIKRAEQQERRAARRWSTYDGRVLTDGDVRSSYFPPYEAGVNEFPQTTERR